MIGVGVQLESLIGHLHHAAKVVWPARTFLRRFRKRDHSIRLNSESRLDLQWWLQQRGSGSLCLFASFLAGSVQHASITERICQPSVPCTSIEEGFPDPLVNCLRLLRVIRGIKRTQGSPEAQRLPITNDILMIIFSSLDLYRLAYFGFLRSAEFTVPSLASFSPLLHLSIQDIFVDSSANPSCLRVKIKASKTDPFRNGCFIHIGRGNFALCALQSVMAYVAVRGSFCGALFLSQDGRPISRAILTSRIRDILARVEVPGNFSSHSFLIGAATMAARSGIPDHLIQPSCCYSLLN